MIRASILIAALLMLGGCTAGAPATVPVAPPVQQLPSAPHWLMRPKTWAEYIQAQGAGVFNPGALVIEPGTLIDIGRFRITNLVTTHNGAPAIARVYGPAGVQVDSVPDDLAGVLVQSFDAWQTYIGEIANAGCADITQPEPVAPVRPAVGDEVFVASTVTQPDDAPKFQFNTGFKTTAVDPDGTVHTTLVEAPFGIGQLTCYHYVFDGEMRSVLFGAVMADDTVPVLQRYTRAAVGVNV